MFASLLVGLGGVGLLTSCGGDSEPSEITEPASPYSPAAPTDTVVDPDHLPVLDAYEAFVQAGAEASNLGEPDHPALADYSDGPALVRTRAAIAENAENGRVYQGTPVIDSAEVTFLDLDAPPEEPNAGVLACVDISDYLLTYVEDGSPVPVDRGLERYQATADLWYVEQRWVVINTEEQRETPC